MTEERLPLDDIGKLAKEAMNDKLQESGDEEQARELYDVPTMSPDALADEQKD